MSPDAAAELSREHGVPVRCPAETRTCSAMFSDFAAPPQDLSCGPRGRLRIFGERHCKRHRSDFFLIFWLRMMHFGLV